jgi:hypothetical protein
MTDAGRDLPPPPATDGPVAEGGEVPIAATPFKSPEAGADRGLVDERFGGRPRLDWSPLTDAGAGRGASTSTSTTNSSSTSGFSFDLGAALARIGAELPAPEQPSQAPLTERPAAAPALPTRAAPSSPPPVSDEPAIAATSSGGPSPAFNLAAALAETTAARRQQPPPPSPPAPARPPAPSIADRFGAASPAQPAAPAPVAREPIPPVDAVAPSALPRRGTPPPEAPELAPQPQPIARHLEPSEPEPAQRTQLTPRHSVFDDRSTDRPSSTAITPSVPSPAPVTPAVTSIPSIPSIPVVPTASPAPTAPADTPITPFGQELPSLPSMAIPTLPNLPPPAPARPAVAEPVAAIPTAPDIAAARAAQLRAKQQQKQRGGRLVLKALLAIIVLGAVVVGALTVGRSRLFPNSWDPALTPIVDQIERTHDAEFERTVALVRQPADEYGVTVSRLLFGDTWVEHVPEWRALGLAAGDLTPERVGGEIGLRRLAVYDPDADRIYMADETDAGAAEADLRVALEAAFRLQTAGEASPAVGEVGILGSPPATLVQRAIERFVAAKTHADTATDPADLPAPVPSAVTAALPLPLEYELSATDTLGAALLRASGADPASFTFANPLPAEIPPGFDDSPVTTTAGLLEAGDRPLADPVSIGVDDWSLVWGDRLPVDTVDRLTTAVTADSYRAFDRGGTTCVAGVFESTEADAGFVLSAIATWAQSAPAESTATVSSLSPTLAQLIACDPGIQDGAAGPQTAAVAALIQRQLERLAPV